MRKPLPAEVPQSGFNLQVHQRDDKTGLVVNEDPYILRIVGEAGSSDRAEYFERPKGSGNLFNRRGEAIGRWVYEDKEINGKKIKVGSFAEGVAHIAFVPPQTKDQILAQSLTEKDVKIAELERELKAIQAEKENKKPAAPSLDKKRME